MLTNSVKDAQPIHSLDQFEREFVSRIPLEGRIDPAHASGNVSVCIVSSEEYAPFAAVTVQSILENVTEGYFYDIVVLTDDMSVKNCRLLEESAQALENCVVRVFDISRLVDGMQFYTWAHFTNKTYYRLLTPDIFAAYDKVIYLDSDVVVNCDIAQLFSENLEGYYLAAAYDTHVMSYCTREPPLEQREYNQKVLGLQEPEMYFQAGVSIFNVKLINSTFKKHHLIRQGMEHKLRWLDQDLLNKLFCGKIKPLPNRWNVMVANIPDNLDEYFLNEPYRTEYYEARLSPSIVHYVGKAMPCYTLQPDLYEYFWKYARRTVFYEVLLQRQSSSVAAQLIEHNRRREKTTFKERIISFFKSFINFLLPKGSKRRTYIKNFVFKLRKWN